MIITAVGETDEEVSSLWTKEEGNDGENLWLGLHPDMTNEKYHSTVGLSRSALWDFKQLPYKYWYKHLSGRYEKPVASEALLFGSLVHTVILEPTKFEERYHVMPKVNRTTKAGKSAWYDALEQAGSKILINEEQYSTAHDMRDIVMSNETAQGIIDTCMIEHSIFWQDADTRLTCKSRPDCWGKGLIADLKTANDASPRAFQYAAVKDGYFLQAAMMIEAAKSLGEEIDKFVFIVVEKTPPYATGLYVLDAEAIKYGQSLFHKILADYKQCKDNQLAGVVKPWQDFGIQTLCVPAWANTDSQTEWH